MHDLKVEVISLIFLDLEVKSFFLGESSVRKELDSVWKLRLLALKCF